MSRDKIRGKTYNVYSGCLSISMDGLWAVFREQAGFFGRFRKVVDTTKVLKSLKK